MVADVVRLLGLPELGEVSIEGHVADLLGILELIAGLGHLGACELSQGKFGEELARSAGVARRSSASPVKRPLSSGDLVRAINEPPVSRTVKLQCLFQGLVYC